MTIYSYVRSFLTELRSGRMMLTVVYSNFMIVDATDSQPITEDEWQEYCAIRAQQETPDE